MTGCSNLAFAVSSLRASWSMIASASPLMVAPTGIEPASFDKLRMTHGSRPLPSNAGQSFLVRAFALLSPR
jgi:hypothetical protein